jgi:hypothetical protein
MRSSNLELLQFGLLPAARFLPPVDRFALIKRSRLFLKDSGLLDCSVGASRPGRFMIWVTLFM